MNVNNEPLLSSDVRDGIAIGGAFLTGLTWIVLGIVLMYNNCGKQELHNCVEAKKNGIILKTQHGYPLCDDVDDRIRSLEMQNKQLQLDLEKERRNH